jgi:uncharacterized membrane protein
MQSFMRRKNIMSWNNEQQQEFSAQHSYAGYTGSSAQSSQMFEQPSQHQQQTFQQPEFQSTYGQQAPYSYPPVFSPAPALDGTRLAGALSYALGWFSGILFLLFAGENRYIRFHALQSIAFFGFVNLLDFVVPLSWIGARSFHAPWLFILSFFFLLFLNIIAFVGWLVAMVQAGRGIYYKLPFVGNAIAQHVNWNPTLK